MHRGAMGGGGATIGKQEGGEQGERGGRAGRRWRDVAWWMRWCGDLV